MTEQSKTMPARFTVQETENKLNSISPTICAAKWKFSTIWLNIQKTASCFHCPAEQIDTYKVIKNPSLFHNTPQKIQDRYEMIDGKWPDVCNHCEHVSKPAYPDRVTYSDRHDVDLFLKEYTNVENTNPEILEVSFDSYCDFACAYCNKVFSSKWHADLNKHGAYENISDIKPYTPERNFPITADPKILNAFADYVKTLSDQKILREIKLTGGEPLINKYFWTFVDLLDPSIKLTINTNLGNLSDSDFDKLKKLAAKHNQVIIHTSGESIGEIAEFIRDGKDWTRWIANVNRIMAMDNIKFVCNVTVNALSAIDTIRFINTVVTLRQGKNAPMWLSFSILTTPIFLRVEILSNELKEKIAAELESLLRSSTDLMPAERNGVIRIIQKLRRTIDGDNIIDTKHFKSFVQQYMVRRNKDLNAFNAYPEFIKWFNAI